MFKTSHLQELKRRYREIYAPKPEKLDEHCGVCGEGGEHGIEEGKPSRKLAQRDVGMECQECGKRFRAKLSTLQYGKTKCPKCKSTDLDFAYGAKNESEVKEDTDKDEPGTQGDQAEYQKKRKEVLKKFGVGSCSELEGEKKKACYAALDAAHVSDDEEEDEDDDPVGKNEEVEIEEGTALQVRMALDDVGLKGKWKNNKVYVKKRDVEKAKKALKGNVIYRGKPPVVVGEEVEIEEGKMPRGIRLTSELLNNMKKFGVELEKYAKKSGGIDKDDFMRVAAIAKKGTIPDKSDIPDDTDPRDKVLSMMAGIVGDEILLAYKGISPSIDNYIKKTMKEHCGECEMGITEEVSAKEFDALKKGDTVTIEFKSSMSSGKATFKVTAKNVVGKARIEKVTLKDVKRPSGVKFFLYKRGNKVSLAQGDMAASVVSFAKEEVEIDEKRGSGYDLYHKTFSAAMQHAYAHAKKKGVIVDPKEIDDKVATGPKKPSSGKTNRYILGTNTRKKVHIQVANLDNKRYELNMYIESKNDHLGKVKNILERINLIEVDLDEKREETPAEWEKRTGKKPTKYTGPDKKDVEQKKTAFLKAFQKTKEKEKPKKSKPSRRYVQKSSRKTREVPYREKPAEIAQHYKLPDYIVHDDIKKFPRILMGGIDKITPGVKFQKHVINHQTFGKIPGLGIFLPGDSSPKLMIQWNQRIHDPKIDYIWADPQYAEKGTDPSTYRKNDMIVWINEAATNNPALKGKVDWYQRKEFEGATPDNAAKRTLQYLKTKIKRMAKEEVELASMTEEIQKLEERRQSYSNFIPFPEKILTDFAKRAMKAGLTFAQYMKYVKGTFKDGADSNNAIIFGRDVYKKKKGAVDPDAWSLKREEVIVEREMTAAEKDKREEIVLSLKKKTKDFKERYGDKWKEVMYATATKMAMGEEEDPKSKKKDKINLKPKMDEKMKTYKDLIKGLKESNPKPQVEIYEGYEKAVLLSLEDEGIEGHFEYGKVVVAKRDVKRAKETLDNDPDIRRTPKIVGEETEEASIKEGVTEQGVEYGEQVWDLEMRPDALYPNLNVNFAEFMESDLEGPYLFKGEHYFFDRKINGWYSMSSEDYVSEAEAEELHMAYNKHGLSKAQFSN